MEKDLLNDIVLEEVNMESKDDSCHEEMYNTVYREMIGIIGLENTLKLFSQFSGNQISFPKRLYSPEYVEKKVAEEYDGTNIKVLAKKYSYTERWIREKVRDISKKQEPHSS